jgi:hypothetical protein
MIWLNYELMCFSRLDRFSGTRPSSAMYRLADSPASGRAAVDNAVADLL